MDSGKDIREKEREKALWQEYENGMDLKELLNYMCVIMLEKCRE